MKKNVFVLSVVVGILFSGPVAGNFFTDTADKITETYHNAGDAATEAYHGTGDAATDVYHSAGDAATEAYHGAGDAATEAYHGAGDAATGLYSLIKVQVVPESNRKKKAGNYKLLSLTNKLKVDVLFKVGSSNYYLVSPKNTEELFSEVEVKQSIITIRIKDDPELCRPAKGKQQCWKRVSEKEWTLPNDLVISFSEKFYRFVVVPTNQ